LIPASAANPKNMDDDADDDMDSKIDQCIRDVWAYYDKKNKGFLTKGEAETFFKDALNIMCLRKGVKAKDILPPGVSEGKAISQSFQKLDKNGTGKIDFNAFEEFINMSDLDEALSLFTGQQGPISVATDKVKLVDTSQFAAGAKANAANIQYRDYPDD